MQSLSTTIKNFLINLQQGLKIEESFLLHHYSINETLRNDNSLNDAHDIVTSLRRALGKLFPRTSRNT